MDILKVKWLKSDLRNYSPNYKNTHQNPPQVNLMGVL